MYRLLSLALCAILISCSATQSVKHNIEPPKIAPIDKSSVYIQFPKEKEIEFLGQIDVDKANSQNGGMAYPGYNAATFLVGILVHAAVQGGVTAAQERKKQNQANKVLLKYQPGLSRVTGLGMLANGESINVLNTPVTILHDSTPEKKPNTLVAKVKPIFFLSQNEKSLVLVNHVNITPPTPSNTESHSMLVEYVSNIGDQHKPEDFWMNNDYSNLLSESQFMFLETLRLSMEHKVKHTKNQYGKQKTIRYMESGAKKIERGYLISQSCKRIVFLTLRETIKSAPLFNIPTTCTTPPEVALK